MEASDVNRGARPRPPRPQNPPTTQQTQSLSRIKSLRDEAFLYIEQGLACDEHAQTEQAQVLYTKGLAAIDNTVGEYQSALRLGPCTGQEWDKVKNMITTMQQTKTRIQERVDEMSRNDQAVIRALHDPPPSYQQSLTPSSIDDLEDSLLTEEQAQLNRDLAANATELFRINDGVQIFFITGDGFVSAPSYPSSLAIYKFRNESANASRPSTFLKIGTWTYPLLPGQSPALQSSYGAYMFPDVTAPNPGASVGVLLPDSVSEQQKSRFQNLLNELTDYQDQTVTPTQLTTEQHRDSTTTDQPPTSEKISDGIVSAAGWLATGLTKGAQQASHLMRRGSESLRQRITPEQQPTYIDPRYQTGAEYAHKATRCALGATGYVINKLGQATAALAKELAPHVKAGSEKVLPASFTKKDPSGRSTMDDINTVAQGGLKGFGTLHLALEGAARTLLTSLKEETSSVVKHKYGEDAGKFAGNTVGAGANVVLTAGMVNNMGAKMIARSAAKHYARELAQEGEESKETATKQKNGKLQEKADMDEQLYHSKQDISRGSSACANGMHTTSGTTHNASPSTHNASGGSSRSLTQSGSSSRARSLYPPGTAPALPK